MKIKKITTLIMATSMLAMAIGCTVPVVQNPSESSNAIIAPDSEEPSSSEEPSETSNVAEGTVYNDGGHFVQIGNKVYFRQPGQEAMAMSALYGDYSGTTGADSALVSYDLDTQETAVVFDDCGYGSIYYNGGCFYIPMTDAEGNFILSKVNPDGSREHVDADDIGGCSKDGKYLALLKFDENYNTGISVYKDGEFLSDIKSETESLYVEAIDNDYLIYRAMDFASEEYTSDLYAYDLNSLTSLKLGTLPSYEDMMGSAEIAQVVFDGNKLYFSLGVYGGTGHFLYSAYFCEADLTAEGSLVCDSANGGEEEVIPAFIIENGEFTVTEGVPMSAKANVGDGNIYVYDEAGKGRVIASGYEYQDISEDETGYFIEGVCYLNGRVFAVKNLEQRKPEDDIGWRYAYVRKETNIFVFGDDGSENIIVTVKAE